VVIGRVAVSERTREDAANCQRLRHAARQYPLLFASTPIYKTVRVPFVLFPLFVPTPWTSPLSQGKLALSSQSHRVAVRSVAGPKPAATAFILEAAS
jgi:hypothetical protein